MKMAENQSKMGKTAIIYTLRAPLQNFGLKSTPLYTGKLIVI